MKSALMNKYAIEMCMFSKETDFFFRSINFKSQLALCILLNLIMSKTKEYFYDLLDEAIQGPSGDNVNLPALRELLQASIELQLENHQAKINKIRWLRDNFSSQSSDEYFSSRSSESLLSPRTSVDDGFKVKDEANALKKTVVSQEIDLATNAILSTISTTNRSKSFTHKVTEQVK